MPWICQECGTEIWVDRNMAILKDDLWKTIAEKKDVLCNDCIEKRLKRKITTEDLKEGVPCNYWFAEEQKLLDYKY